MRRVCERYAESRGIQKSRLLSPWKYSRPVKVINDVKRVLQASNLLDEAELLTSAKYQDFRTGRGMRERGSSIEICRRIQKGSDGQLEGAKYS